MKEIYLKAIQAYIEMLTIHIHTKTLDPVFHEKTQDFYEKLFAVAHQIGERYIDRDGSLKDEDLMALKQRALELLEEVNQELVVLNDSGSLSLGTQDLVGGLSDELEDAIGNAKAFVKKTL